MDGDPRVQNRVHSWLVGLLGSWIVRLLSLTWEFHVHDPDGIARDIETGRQQALVAFWHRHILSLLARFRGHPYVVPISEHQDGEFIAQTMQRMGLTCVRGSTTRGSLKAVRGLLKSVRRGLNPAITPDGPKGPRYSVQPGFAMLARRCSLPVYAVGVHVDRAWVLPSWDAFVIPKPGARIGVAFMKALSAEDVGRDRDAHRSCGVLSRCLGETEVEARDLVEHSTAAGRR